MAHRLLSRALVFPHRGVSEARIVTLGFTVVGLMLLAEVPAARLFAKEGVFAHELTELEEVGDPASLLELLIELGALPWHYDVLPKLLAQLRDARQCFAQALGVAGHTALVPHQAAELLVERIDG